MNPRQVALCVLAAVLLTPPLRHWMEADMALHMLLEFTALLATGAIIFDLLPPGVQTRVEQWNRLGITGFVLASLALAYWMIPAALDASLASAGFASAKYGSLMLAGVALRSSFALAPKVMQVFFVGNLVWMTASVGLIYQDNPRQLCLYYLVDAQVRAGTGLVLLAMLLAVASCFKVARHVPAQA
jgi:hypothetical protein